MTSRKERKARNKQTKRSSSCGRSSCIFKTALFTSLCVFFIYYLWNNRLTLIAPPFLQTIPTPSILLLNLSDGLNPSNIARPPDLSHDFQTTSSQFQYTSSVLRQHPLVNGQIINVSSMEVEDILRFLQSQPTCKRSPIYTTMASVGSALYWQLIQNFIYSMVKFNLSNCALMICVSDLRCMQRCKKFGFPCYDFRYRSSLGISELPSTMEQIAVLKLHHLPKALLKGVDVFTLDLDVGFLDNPQKLVDIFYSKDYDIMVQQDISFVMHRSAALWRTWFTEPSPNIGIMICRGNSRTHRMFQRAWAEYQKSDPAIRDNPGKDQNKVTNAMRDGRYDYGLKWNFFNPNLTVLVDKVHKFEDNRVELGGQKAAEIFRSKKAVAVHTTCYEHKNKVMGLKASNAFWSPYYYNPRRATITKKLIFVDHTQLLQEIRSLLYLSIRLKRTLIIPNILGPTTDSVTPYMGSHLWPGFRVLHQKFGGEAFSVDVAEPAFYWRMVAAEYASPDEAPKPSVVRFSRRDSIDKVYDRLAGMKESLRVVLDFSDGDSIDDERDVAMIAWSEDSVGLFNSYDVEIKEYTTIPKVWQPRTDLLGAGPVGDLTDKALIRSIVQSFRLCERIFEPYHGNRSCFDKCR